MKDVEFETSWNVGKLEFATYIQEAETPCNA